MNRIFFIFLFLPTGIFPQQWVNMNEHLSHYNVTDLNFIDDETGFMVTTNEGAINALIIYDFGETWEPVNMPLLNEESHSFDVINEFSFIVGSYFGSLYKTTDQGVQWKA